LHNDELHDLYSSPNIVGVIKARRLRWVGHVACMGEGRGVYRVFVGKPEGKRPMGRPRRRWDDNMKLDLKGDRDRWGKPDSAGSGYGPMADFCENGTEALGSIKKGGYVLTS
jgi:hypothetical protein